MRRVEQGAQCASRRAGQAADHVRQADRVGTAPRDEGELDVVLQLFAVLLVLVPVAVQREHLAARLVDREHVGRRRLVVLKGQVGVDLVDDAQAVLVVARRVAALDLVVGHTGHGLLGLHARQRHVDVAVHARLDAALILEGREVLDVRAALGRVEVGRRVGQVHVVDRHEQEGRPVARLVPAQLEVLRTAQWHLRHELLQLGADLGALHGHLPVEQAHLALGLVDLLLRHRAGDVVLGRAAGREDLLHGSGREVDAGLGHERVHHLRCAGELRAAGCVVAQTGAA